MQVWSQYMTNMGMHIAAMIVGAYFLSQVSLPMLTNANVC